MSIEQIYARRRARRVLALWAVDVICLLVLAALAVVVAVV